MPMSLTILNHTQVAGSYDSNSSLGSTLGFGNSSCTSTARWPRARGTSHRKWPCSAAGRRRSTVLIAKKLTSQWVPSWFGQKDLNQMERSKKLTVCSQAPSTLLPLKRAMREGVGLSENREEASHPLSLLALSLASCSRAILFAILLKRSKKNTRK